MQHVTASDIGHQYQKTLGPAVYLTVFDVDPMSCVATKD